MIWEQCSPKLKLGENETRHNIDIAPRVDALEVDDSVRFNGEYVWNEKGGVVHWTHHDPRGRHASGWLIHNNKTYQ